MRWKEHRAVDLKKEFVLAAISPGGNVAQVLPQYGISRNNRYKWIRRYRSEGEKGLEERSRRTLKIAVTDGETVLRAIELSRKYRWGAKKLRKLLVAVFGARTPSVKTVARILDRAGEPRIRRPRPRIDRKSVV